MVFQPSPHVLAVAAGEGVGDHVHRVVGIGMLGQLRRLPETEVVCLAVAWELPASRSVDHWLRTC